MGTLSAEELNIDHTVSRYHTRQPTDRQQYSESFFKKDKLLRHCLWIIDQYAGILTSMRGFLYN